MPQTEIQNILIELENLKYSETFSGHCKVTLCKNKNRKKNQRLMHVRRTFYDLKDRA